MLFLKSYFLPYHSYYFFFLINFSAAPLVLDFDKSKNLIQEDNLELKCQVKGYPRIPVMWLKDGKPLNITEQNDRIRLSSLNGYKDAFLKIESVEFDDEGEYTCEAVSEQFNVTSRKSVTVRVKGGFWMSVLFNIFDYSFYMVKFLLYDGFVSFLLLLQTIIMNVLVQI